MGTNKLAMKLVRPDRVLQNPEKYKDYIETLSPEQKYQLIMMGTDYNQYEPVSGAQLQSFFRNAEKVGLFGSGAMGPAKLQGNSLVDNIRNTLNSNYNPTSGYYNGYKPTTPRSVVPTGIPAPGNRPIFGFLKDS